MQGFLEAIQSARHAVQGMQPAHLICRKQRIFPRDGSKLLLARIREYSFVPSTCATEGQRRSKVDVAGGGQGHLFPSLLSLQHPRRSSVSPSGPQEASTVQLPVASFYAAPYRVRSQRLLCDAPGVTCLENANSIPSWRGEDKCHAPGCVHAQPKGRK